MPLFSAIFSRHRIVFCAAFLMLGILAARSLPSILPAFLVALPFAVFAAAKFRKFAFVIFFPLGILLPFFQTQTPDPVLAESAGKYATVTGRLYENAQKKPGSVKIPVKVDAAVREGKTERADGKILIYSNGLERLAYGDRIEARLKLKPVSSFKNPGASGYEQRLAAKGVFFTGYLDAEKIKTLGADVQANRFLLWANRLRSDYAAFVRSALPASRAEIVNALSIGEKGAIDDGMRRKFSALGIGHLLAISGLHVGIAAIFFYLSAKWLLKRSQYLMVVFIVPKLAAMATIPAVFLYSLLTGLSNSSVRAAIMAAVYLTAIAVGRRDDRLNSLAAAAIIILAVSPGALFEASFILSFSAVLGILLAAARFSEKEKKEDAAVSGKNFAQQTRVVLFAALLTTAAATVATLPFVINMFGFLPVLTFPANLAAMPIAVALVPLCILSLSVFATLGFVPDFLLDSVSLLAASLEGVAEALFSLVPVVTVPALGKITFGLFYLLAASLLLAKRSRKILRLFPIFAVCLAASLAYDLRPPGGGQTEASFFDAGRKNIALFTFSDGKTVLIKGGFSKNARSDFIDKSVVSPALLKKRITKTDFLILLSADGSQLNGAAALIEKNGVENLWTNGPKLNGKLWTNVEKYGALWKNIHRSDADLKFGKNGETQIKFLKLWEKLGIADSSAPRPMLVKVVCGKTSFLLMESVHNTFLKDVEKLYGSEIASDVVFLPEISRSGRDAVFAILKSARPSIVVCRSCLSELKNRGLRAEIRQTETEGMISIFTDGEKITKAEGFSAMR